MSSVITLRLLGSAAIESDGQVLTGRAAQKRRLAVLSLLALAPARGMTRERVMAYLWPESDTQQARHLLAVAIYELRKVLGEDVILTRGDDIELNAARVATDVDAFEAACQAGDLERATSLYAGPFLDGFHINDAPDFERWADGERDRLAHRHAVALEGIARARTAAGNVTGAVETWRSLAGIDPYNSRIARELMLALEAAGDRAGALQLARVHTLLLKEEFGADPDEDFTSLAERLRNARTPPPAAPPPTPAVRAVPDDAVSLPDTPAETTATPLPVVTSAEPAASSNTAIASIAANDVAEPGPRAAVRRPGNSRRITWAALSLGLIAIIAWPMWKLGANKAPTPDSPVAITVLPFRNLESAPEHALFAAGLGEEISMALGRLEGLRVVGGSSVDALRGDETTKQIGSLLGVGYLVGGSLQTGGDRMYVRAWLDDASTGDRIWSQRFDRPLKMADKVAVQEEIGHAVVDALQLKLPASASGALLIGITDNFEAYNLFRAGREQFDRRTAEGLIASLRFFQKATELDPSYALAHAAQAEVFTLLGAYDYSVLEPKQAFESARAAARRALELDPELAQAYSALGSVAFNYDRDPVEAERAFKKAIAVNRGYAQAYHWYSLFLATRNRMTEAGVTMQHAGELDPISMVMRTALARQAYFARDFDVAIDRYREAVAHDSTFVRARLGLAISLAGAGMHADAIAHLQASERLLKGPQPVTQGLLGYIEGTLGHRDIARRHLAALHTMEARQYVAPEYFAIVHIGLGDHASAMEALEKALQIRSGGIAYLGIEPIVDPLRRDPRFVNLLWRAGLQAGLFPADNPRTGS